MSPKHSELSHAHAMEGHGHSDPPHGNLRSYSIGFALSVILTAIPFWLVISGALGSTQITAAAIMVLAFIQIIVHMVYFLHMSPKSEGGWVMMALIFTAVIVVIALTGSLWVMYHMNTNMMPMSADSMRTMP